MPVLNISEREFLNRIMADLYVNARLTIPSGEMTVSASRSSGPGGQNVNKVNSKVTLHWSPGDCVSMGPDWRRRFLASFRNRINGEGKIVISSQQYRDQGRNLADVRQRLVTMLLSCQNRRKTGKPLARRWVANAVASIKNANNPKKNRIANAPNTTTEAARTKANLL